MTSTPLDPKKDALGYITGILAPTAFGFMPLFTMPLIHEGMNTASILAYRFLLAALILFFILLAKGKKLAVKKKELSVIALLAILYIWSSVGVQLGYRFMPTSVTTVIHFTYPVWVVILMLIIYKERPHGINLIAIFLAIVGVMAQAGIFEGASTFAWQGILIVASTGLAYALYMIVVAKSGIGALGPLKLSFYVLLFAGIGFGIFALLSPLSSELQQNDNAGFQFIHSWRSAYNVLLLSLVSTVLANIFLVDAVKKIGATLNAVLGALEPLTALVVGSIVFDEELTPSAYIGIVLIVFSVTLIATSGKIAYILKVKKLRRRK